jgi:hypothetical protein
MVYALDRIRRLLVSFCEDHLVAGVDLEKLVCGPLTRGYREGEGDLEWSNGARKVASTRLRHVILVH